MATRPRRIPPRRPVRQPPEPLSRERIAAAAVDLIDAEGLEALTTRRLGAALGCEAMSIYHYFASKGELLDAVASHVLGLIELPAPGDGDWRARLRRIAERHQAVATAHPEAFTLSALRRLNTPEAFRFMECILGCLDEAGFDPEMRAAVFRLLGQWATGAALSALATDSMAPHPTARVRAEQMDFSRYPLTTRSTPFLMPDHFASTYRFGLEAILDAVDRAPRESPRRRRGRQ